MDIRILKQSWKLPVVPVGFGNNGRAVSEDKELLKNLWAYDSRRLYSAHPKGKSCLPKSYNYTNK